MLEIPKNTASFWLYPELWKNKFVSDNVKDLNYIRCFSSHSLHLLLHFSVFFPLFEIFFHFAVVYVRVRLVTGNAVAFIHKDRFSDEAKVEHLSWKKKTHFYCNSKERSKDFTMKTLPQLFVLLLKSFPSCVLIDWYILWNKIEIKLQQKNCQVYCTFCISCFSSFHWNILGIP